MRTEFIAGGTRKQAVAAMPWAVKIIKVDGGYRGFESLAAYATWIKQT